MNDRNQPREFVRGGGGRARGGRGGTDRGGGNDQGLLNIYK